MEIAVKPFLIGVNPRVNNANFTTLYHKHMVNVSAPTVSSKRARFGPRRNCKTPELSTRSHKYCSSVFAVLSGVEDVSVSSSQFDDFLVTISGTDDTRKLKVSVEVSGTKTRAIFDDVFDKMVAEAQPIPGFRRVKGGKTPNEGLKVSTDLRVEQSFEDLEDMFEPDEKFSFDAVIQLQETD
ncbi:uncharacterized protein LOC123220297 isoform X4 [Mangifera indica]|uniref:uncharacterized protein LOC123220297 isoform X4 n=1 Tax=Mangifera indica TaxID=29780 RepID=UPI001CFB0A46|nr:uncharacterized protein LOC123220297 isoform X4 [Mangifera indica]